MAGKTSASQTAYYARYKAARTWEKNRIARLQRTLKAQPNNKQVEEALKKGPIYRRATPKTSEWSSSWIATAKVVKQFTGIFDRGYMSANQDVAFTARSKTKNVGKPVHVDQKHMFSLLARVNLNSKGTTWQ